MKRFGIRLNRSCVCVEWILPVSLQHTQGDFQKLNSSEETRYGM